MKIQDYYPAIINFKHFAKKKITIGIYEDLSGYKDLSDYKFTRMKK